MGNKPGPRLDGYDTTYRSPSRKEKNFLRKLKDEGYLESYRFIKKKMASEYQGYINGKSYV